MAKPGNRQKDNPLWQEYFHLFSVFKGLDQCLITEAAVCRL